MIKMYNVEVLSKFPVVQHFPFGSLFAWEKDPAAKQIQASVHTSSQPKSSSMSSSAPTSRQPALRDPLANPSQVPRDPLAAGGPGGMPMTAAPWATARTGAPQGLRDPMAAGGPAGMPMTAAPWAARGGAPAPASTFARPMENTRAPWAKGGEGAGSGGPLPRR
jgi:serine/threonine-protein phosphatase 2A activator